MISTAFWTHSCDPNSVTGDPDPIWICVRKGPNTYAIRRPIHEIICRLVPVCAVNPKFCHFMWMFVLMSFLYLLLSVSVYMLLLSFHVIVWFILPVWLLVLLHEISMSFHLNYVVYMSIFCVISYVTICHLWFWTSVVYLTLGLDLVFDPLMISNSISPVFSMWYQLITIHWHR